MKSASKSIRTFIGAKDYDDSREFYHFLGFEEVNLGPTMSYFRISDTLGFYLQNAYVKDWINNSMVFLEVENLDLFQCELLALQLDAKYPKVRITAIRNEEWGRELFMHDPSGVLWHFGEFRS